MTLETIAPLSEDPFISLPAAGADLPGLFRRARRASRHLTHVTGAIHSTRMLLWISRRSAWYGNATLMSQHARSGLVKVFRCG
ncbi:hypothetical protein, partial [Mesorhizobium escarrei]|uniref:hypothetical protein n=1 Tax=Mesorhizobium escarrei TaxID=666018 RepID=UPI0020A77F63